MTSGGRRAAAAAAFAVLTAALAACGGSSHPSITVTSSGCRVSGNLPAGAIEIPVRNRRALAVSIEVLGTGDASGRVFGETEMVAAHTTAMLPITVGAGTYSVVCRNLGDNEGVGDHDATFTVKQATNTGTVAGRLPVRTDDFIEPIARYRTFVADQTTALLDDLGRVRTALARNDTAGARDAYARAHADFVAIGVAYDALGDTGTAIAGGMRKLEHELWDGTPPAAASAVAEITNAAQKLRDDADSLVIDPLAYVRQAHETMEAALQDAASGVDHPASHTGIVDVAAAIKGSHFAVGTMQSLVDRYLELKSLNTRFDRLDAVVTKLADRTAPGGFRPDNALTATERTALSGALGGVLEPLGLMAGLLEPEDA